MTQKHTPLPWELDPEGKSRVYTEGYDNMIPHYRILGVIGGKAGRTVADVGGWRDRLNAKADASFIVQACNAHEDLLAAVEEAVGWLDSSLSAFNPLTARGNVERARDILRAAIANATSPQADHDAP